MLTVPFCLIVLISALRLGYVGIVRWRLACTIGYEGIAIVVASRDLHTIAWYTRKRANRIQGS